MKLAVLGALGEEIDGLRKAMTDGCEIEVGAFYVLCGRLYDTDVILCKCGVGKTNAAAAASAILAVSADVNAVINTGVAGGIGGGIKRGEVALGLRTVHHDYDQTPDGLRKGQVQGFDSEFFDGDARMLQAMREVLTKLSVPFKEGTIASGDRFIASKAEGERINAEFGAIACDFESAPIAQVCALYKVPFIALRAISDGGDEQAVESFYAFLQSAADKNCRALCEFCKNPPQL